MKENTKEILHSVIGMLEKNSEKFSKDRFMDEQYEVVCQILDAYDNGIDDVIIEAPTGTGKTIIGLVVSQTINLANNGTQSYFLTASKSLQDQLEIDSSEFKVDWKVLKGQANYTCLENGENFTKRQCKDSTISQAEKTLECAKSCEYIVRRREAMGAQAAVLSYAYWLTAMNYVYSFLQDYAPFGPRELTVFDECHTVGDIVQNMFTVEFNDKIKARLETILYYVKYDQDDEEIINRYVTIIDDIQKIIDFTFEQFDRLSNNQFIQIVEKIQGLLNEFFVMCQKHEGKYFPEKITELHHKKLEKEIEALFTLSRNMSFYVANNKNHIENIIKHIEKKQTDYGEVRTIVLRTLDEARLVKEHVIAYSRKRLWMSGTIGNIDQYARLMGIENYKAIYLDSKFKFKDSEIYTVLPKISLAYKHKAQSMPILIERVFKICNEFHPHERGIIHTGNFEISTALRKVLTDLRFLFYKNSFEKQDALERMKRIDNAVIIGPSLIEGISLDDDLSRFQICCKVPYPSLADVLNVAKKDRIPGWYDFRTTQDVIQAFGRSIRNKNDWAKTYLMDSCYDMVFSRNKIPNFIVNRFTTIDVDYEIGIKNGTIKPFDEDAFLNLDFLNK